MKKEAKRQPAERIAIIAMYVAIIVVLDLIDIGRFIMIFGVKPTVLLIPVILAAQNEDFLVGLISGTAFGLLSFIKNFTHPSLFVKFFYNPLISIVPRMLIPVVVFFVFKALKRKNFYIATIISTILGVVTNTGLVLGGVLAFSGGVAAPVDNTWLGIVVGILSFNFPIELVFCLVVIPAATVAMHKARRIPLKFAAEIHDSGGEAVSHGANEEVGDSVFELGAKENEEDDNATCD